MFKLTKFNVCVIGMVVGIGLISILPFVGLSCRWCTTGVLLVVSNKEMQHSANLSHFDLFLVF